MHAQCLALKIMKDMFLLCLPINHFIHDILIKGIVKTIQRKERHFNTYTLRPKIKVKPTHQTSHTGISDCRDTWSSLLSLSVHEPIHRYNIHSLRMRESEVCNSKVPRKCPVDLTRDGAHLHAGSVRYGDDINLLSLLLWSAKRVK